MSNLDFLSKLILQNLLQDQYAFFIKQYILVIKKQHQEPKNYLKFKVHVAKLVPQVLKRESGIENGDLFKSPYNKLSGGFLQMYNFR